MGSMFRHSLFASALLVTVSAGAPAAQEPPPGERIQNASCTTCHDTRPIQVQALTQEGWLARIRVEIERGAQIAEDDIPILADYLTLNHGPLPDGAGRNVLLTTCTVCHDLRRVKLHFVNAEGWEETLVAMLNEGAQLSERDFPVLLAYLAANFGEF
jgi:cytochrome c5